MNNRPCKSIPNKFVSVSENVSVSYVVQTGVDCMPERSYYVIPRSSFCPAVRPSVGSFLCAQLLLQLFETMNLHDA